MNRINLSLIIPFYNEEHSIRHWLACFVNNLKSEIPNLELILVDNGSRDETGKLLKEIAQGNEIIKTVTVPENQGCGGGLISGFRQARGEWVGFIDGDGQLGWEEVLKGYRKLREEGLDLVKGVRAKRTEGPGRKIISLIYNFLFRILFKISLSDINAKPKILRREILESLNVESKDYFIDAEIILKAQKLNLKIGEFSYEPLPRQGGESKVSLIVAGEFLKNMFRYYFKKK